MRKNDRDTIIYLGALQIKIEEMLENIHEPFLTAKKELKLVKTYLTKALKLALEHADESEQRAIHNHIDTYILSLSPKSFGKESEYKVVRTDTMISLLGDVISDCKLCCEKEGEKAKKCKRRKMLLEVGLVGDDNYTDCEFKGKAEI